MYSDLYLLILKMTNANLTKLLELNLEGRKDLILTGYNDNNCLNSWHDKDLIYENINFKKIPSFTLSKLK